MLEKTMKADLDTLADVYLRYGEFRKEEDFWAWEAVFSLVRTDVNRGWEITLLLLKKAESDKALGYVAAGPLEDLIDGYGQAALDMIETACDADPRLQLALSGVWLLPESPVLARFRALMTKYGFGLTEGKRQPLSPHPDCW